MADRKGWMVSMDSLDRWISYKRAHILGAVLEWSIFFAIFILSPPFPSPLLVFFFREAICAYIRAAGPITLFYIFC